MRERFFIFVYRKAAGQPGVSEAEVNYALIHFAYKKAKGDRYHDTSEENTK